MTLQEAYIKAKMSAEWLENAYLIACKDYGDLWGFSFSPYEPHIRVGGGYDVTVNKKTGELGKYNPFVDGFDLLDKAKAIPLKELTVAKDPVAKAKKKQPRAPAVAVAS
jgi:hypothetical protein